MKINPSEAIRNSLMMCCDRRELEVAANCIIEMCSAFGMTDDEIVQACNDASGNSSMEDDMIDDIIQRIRA